MGLTKDLTVNLAKTYIKINEKYDHEKLKQKYRRLKEDYKDLLYNHERLKEVLTEEWKDGV